MSASASTRLRQLAHQCHTGELDLQSYRRLRTELLDRLTGAEAVGGEHADDSSTTLPKYPRPNAPPPAQAPTVATRAVPAFVPPAAAPAVPQPVEPAPAAAPARAALTTQAPGHGATSPSAAEKSRPPAAQRGSAPAPAPTAPMESAAPARAAGKGIWVVVAFVVLAAAAGGAYWKFQTAGQPLGAAATPVATAESHQAIRDFLDADDWSDEQIANFNSRWSTLPAETRDAALDAPWYHDFVERVRARVKEERALNATAESAGTVEGPLSALARSVGIDISSPDTPVPVRRAADSGTSASIGNAAAEQPHHEPAQPTKPAAPANSPGSGAAAAAAPNATAHDVRPAGPVAAAAAAAKHPATPATPAPDDNPDKCRVELAGSRKPRCRDALGGGNFGPFLAVVPAGSFDMGSRQVADEQPVHHVTIPKAFAIGEFEVSQGEYQLFCTQTKRACEAQTWPGDDYPVVRVSWQDARDYAAWLSTASGKKYRLATEAEWEYAARAGNTGLFPSGDALSQTDAVFTVTEKLTAPWPRSRRINANAFRLNHSVGNVREWVLDSWVAGFAGAPADGSAREGSAGQRVVRGGSYTDTTAKLRLTTREGIDAATRDAVTGFRLVREL